ncbi:BRO1-like domain-containing protein [Rhodotorula diobovata]|uniref:BRO1-like domain-containing protein n=1 Tax=Rhodotorula diobovata TaxID=5288 RepID=A0A5C5FVY9_9BASI|nr:BRO1-like domain-containing protein [Rhodotorula diobovata]
MSTHNNNLVPLPFKHTQPLATLADDILAHLANTSESTHPDALRPDALAWQHLRLRAFAHSGLPLVHKDSGPLLEQYYAQLSFILTKLPSETPLTFPWYPLFISPSSLPSTSASGAFPPTAASAAPLAPPLALPSLEYERAGVLYDLAAVHAALGTERTRNDEAGIKAAIAAFQTAAGVLTHLLTLLPRLHASLHGGPAPADLSAPTVTALRDLCLAQAQEVAWQKAVMDRLKNGTVAKIAARVAELYALARGAAELARAGTADAQPFAFPEDTIRYLAIKEAHFGAVAQYRRAIDDLGANRYGDELGRLQLAEDKLQEAGKLGRRGVPDAVVRDLKASRASPLPLVLVVLLMLARGGTDAEDNNLIYLSPPTPASSLPPIPPATLARATLPPTLAAPLAHLRAPAIFAALVPRQVAEVLELWEDRKRGWVDERVEARARALECRAAGLLTQLHLPSSLEASHQPLGVPPAVLDAAARVQAEGGVARLEAMMQDVRRVAGVNARMLKEATDTLDRESTADAAHRAGHGPPRWTRPSSDAAAQPLRERAQQLEAVLRTAGDSDALVRAKFGEWEAALRVLEGGRDALAREVPASGGGAGGNGRGEGEGEGEGDAQRDRARRALRALLDQLADLRAARARVVDAARTSIAQCEIRERVLREAERRAAEGRARGGEDEGEGEGVGVGAREGSGLEEWEELLEGEGERLMRVWDEEMRRSALTLPTSDSPTRQAQHSLLASASATPSAAQQARERATAHYATAGDKFVEMLQNLQEGLAFYAKLGKLLGELRDACRSFDYARTAEAQDLARALSAAPSLSPPPPSSAPAPAPAPGTPRRRTPAAAAPPARGPQGQGQGQGGEATPRRSTRRAAQAQAQAQVQDGPASPAPSAVKTPARSKKKAAAPAAASANAKEEEEEETREEEEAGEREEVPAAAAAVGGWDPSQGIRFG